MREDISFYLSCLAFIGGIGADNSGLKEGIDNEYENHGRMCAFERFSSSQDQGQRIIIGKTKVAKKLNRIMRKAKKEIPVLMRRYNLLPTSENNIKLFFDGYVQTLSALHLGLISLGEGGEHESR